MKKQYTVRELLSISTQYLNEKGCVSARLDAELLLGHVLEMSRIDLYLNLDKPLTSKEVDAYRECIGRRARREPVAYITGTKEFYSLPFFVTPAVLIPRPETELLVEKVVALAKARLEAGAAQVRILDVGTGSGAIAIAVARQDPDIQVVAVDLSEEALEVAGRNAACNEVESQVQFVQSDLLAGVEGEFDIICSNPPYLSKAEMDNLQPEVDFEPASALDGGFDGLGFYRRIFAEAPPHLLEGGYLVVEIGAEQGEAVAAIAREYGFTVEGCLLDYGGRDRVVVARWN
ncbi:MAG: peptide chain release factor N(5)-glutamine methyltransferase [Limnochordia bacterium]